MDKVFFKLGGEGGGAFCHPQDTYLMVMLTSICGLLKVTFFFVVCIVLTFQKILLGGILDGPFLSLTGCGFWVFIP